MRYLGLINRESAELRLTQSALQYKLKGDALENSISLSSLRIQVIGLNRARFLLTSLSLPSLVITIEDPRFIQALASQGVESAVLGLQKLKRRRIIKLAIYATPISIALTFALLIPFVLARMPSDSLDQFLPLQTEKKMKSFFTSSAKKRMISKSTKNPEKLEVLTSSIAKGSEKLSQIKIDVIRVDSPEVNAFALPGAVVIVNQGLLDKADEVDEVIGVLAHELSHIELRHNLRLLASSASSTVGYALISMIISPDLVSFFSRGLQTAQLKYSREAETAADERGIELLQKTGYSPQGMIKFFSRLQKVEATRPVGMPSFFRTHPLTDERIKNINEKISLQKFGNQKPPIENISELRN